MSSKVEEITEEQKADILHKMIEMVTRQSDYTYDVAKQHLEDNKWDYIVVLRNYMGITEKKGKKLSVNQEKFKQIRNNMDIAGSKYYNN